MIFAIRTLKNFWKERQIKNPKMARSITSFLKMNFGKDLVSKILNVLNDSFKKKIYKKKFSYFYLFFSNGIRSYP